MIPIIVVLAVGGLSLLLWSRRSRDDGKVRLSGNMELTQVDISFKVPGKLTELAVKEGDRVKKGQLIARIDPLQIQRQKEREQAGVESAQSALAQIGTSVSWQKATLEGDLELRRAEVRQAQAMLDNLLAGSRPQEIQQAEATLADARAQQAQASQDWERAQRLFKNDDISAAQRDQYQTRFNSTSELVRQAENRLSMVKEGPRKEEIEAARAALSRAQAALKIAEANRLEVQRREQELNTRKAEVNRARAQLGVSEAQLEDTAVYSPIDGVVMVKSAERGEVLGAGTTVVTIGDIEHPWLRGYVKETDLGKVKLGQKVKLRTDSYPDKSYWGRISFIASEAEFTPKQIQTSEERVKLVYRIKVEVDNLQQELKSNMPVDAEVEI
jgi:HlyD family secretion protein